MSAFERLATRIMVVMYSLQQARDEAGQGLAEYGLILALVAVVVIGAVTLLGTNINTQINAVAKAI